VRALRGLVERRHEDHGQRARGMEAGADAYITKSSFDQDTLLDTVRMLIGRAAGGTT
jgi:DNA-binding NarL/FixJ family response regulator